MMDLSQDEAEERLRRQHLLTQERTVRKKSTEEAVIASELASLKSAVRVALWRLVFLGGPTEDDAE